MQRPSRPRLVQAGAPRPAPRLARRAQEPAGSSASVAVGVVTALALGALVVLHGLALASAPAAAARTLRATLPALTDLDQALAAHQGDVTALASATGDAGRVPVAGVPIRVEVSHAAALRGGAELRRETLDAMTAQVYDRGHEAFRAEGTPDEGVLSLFSSQWTLRRSMDVMTRGAHDRIAPARLVAFVVAMLAAAALALRVEPGRRPVAIGSALLIGAMLAACGALLARALVWVFTAADSGVTAAVVARIARDATMTVVGAGIVAALTGAVVVVWGLVMARAGALQSAAARTAAEARSPGVAREPWEER